MSTDLVKRTSSQDLAQSKTVPDFVKNSISDEDWGAMPVEERVAAIEFFRAEMETTTEGLSITFPRIKYPTSGTGVFESPTATGTPEYLPTLDGAIVHKQVVRAYWPVGDPIANNPPTCSSPDGERPLAGPGKQAEHCSTCQWAQFGTGRDQSGQACKQRINVFLLRDNKGVLEEIPTLLSVPPSQLKAFSDFAVQVRKTKSTLLSQCTRFGLIDATNRTGVRYKGLALQLARKLTYNEMMAARELATSFRDQMERRGFVAEAEAEEAAQPAAASDHIIDGKAERVPR
jgi:hypothetical protein